MNKRIVLVFLIVVNAVCFSGCGDSTATSVQPPPVVPSVSALPKVVPQACQFGAKDKLLYNSVEQFKKKTLTCLNPYSSRQEQQAYFQACFHYLETIGQTLDEKYESPSVSDKAPPYVFLIPDQNGDGEGGAWYMIDYDRVNQTLKIVAPFLVTSELVDYLSIASESNRFRTYDGGFNEDWKGLVTLILRMENFETTYPDSYTFEEIAPLGILKNWLDNSHAYTKEESRPDIKNRVHTLSITVDEGALAAYKIYLQQSKLTSTAPYYYNQLHEFIRQAYPLLVKLKKNPKDLKAIHAIETLEYDMSFWT
jgi:hypothetical protein